MRYIDAAGDPKPVAEHLRWLLAQPGRYQSRWMRQSSRTRLGQVNDSAVARVVADYLDSIGQLDDLASSRPLKDRIFRALNGHVMTGQTLDLLIQAFNMDSRDAEHLWQLYSGQAAPSAIAGNFQAPTGSMRRNFQTVSLVDFHSIGPNGIPTQHRSVQVLRALEDGLDRYPYRFDTSTIATVEVLNGGNASPVYQATDDLHGVDILLPAALKRGDTATLEYATTFAYDEPPAPLFRRAANHRIENLSMRVEFDHDKLPRRVWWAVWADYAEDSQVLVQEKVHLAPDASVSRHVDALEQTVAGFHWQW